MPVSVPFLDLSRHVEGLKESIKSALSQVVDSGCFVLGSEIAALEESLAQYSEAKFGIACASGSEALLLALMELGIDPGDEVIVPSFTFFATASAVARLGAVPVFADICPDSFCLDPEDVCRKITPRTRALLPVHLFGQAADMTAFRAIAREHSLFIVEDAAQAIGAEAILEDGKPHRVGGLGDIACFSFYPTKNLGAMGDGGALTTSSEERAKNLKLIRNHGMTPRYYHRRIGINGRLDAFQGAVLNCKFPFLDAWIAERTEIAKRYETLFSVRNELCGKIIVPAHVSGARHVWNQYCIRVLDEQRDALRTHLASERIGSEIYYPLGLHEQDCFAGLGYTPESLPWTYRISREILALPIFPGLTPEEQERVVAGIAQFWA